MAYFTDVAYLGSRITCRNCKEETLFSNANRYNTSEGTKFKWEYQCQDCGALEMSEYDTACDDALVKRCTCGGQFRRDKPLFCSHCLINKTEENKSDIQ
jgi:hypothetical protein